MKKVVLLLLSAVGILSAEQSLAQSFHVGADTVRLTLNYSGSVESKTEIHNTTTGSLDLNWKLTSTTLPATWFSLTTGFGICDNVQCYNFYSDDINKSYTAASIPASGKMDYKILLDGSTLPSGGPYYIMTQVTDAANSANTKEVVFALNKYPTSVPTANKVLDVSIYPNPAKEEINVVFGPNVAVRNISVYNLIGKVISVYRVQGTSAKLNLENIPSGIYFMRLIDAQGQVVATRKFTHQ